MKASMNVIDVSEFAVLDFDLTDREKVTELYEPLT